MNSDFQAGHNGGRWELDRSADDVALVESLARAVIASRVIETFTPARSRVVVTLDDDSTYSETGYVG